MFDKIPIMVGWSKRDSKDILFTDVFKVTSFFEYLFSHVFPCDVRSTALLLKKNSDLNSTCPKGLMFLPLTIFWMRIHSLLTLYLQLLSDRTLHFSNVHCGHLNSNASEFLIFAQNDKQCVGFEGATVDH